jgi:hypothetical protein
VRTRRGRECRAEQREPGDRRKTATTLRTVDSGRNHLRAPSSGHGGSGRSTLYDYQV